MRLERGGDTGERERIQSEQILVDGFGKVKSKATPNSQAWEPG